MSAIEVVITGVGVISPIGIGREAVWESFCSGRSGVKRLSLLEAGEFPVRIGAAVEGFDPKAFVTRKSLKVMARDAQFGVAVSLLACRDAGIAPGKVDPERLGVLLGADRISHDLETSSPPYRASVVDGRFDFGRWGREGLAATFPLTFLTVLPNMTSSHVAIALDARGPNNTIHHGDASSLLALGEAARIIQRGSADVMVAGGASSQFTPFDWSRHCVLGRLSRRADDPAAVARPFDALRDGEVHGEGAAAFVLESRPHAEARSARVLARLAGWSAACDPPSAAGRGVALCRAVRAAMDQAGLSAADVDHVNAHGASTVEDDAAEARALSAVLPGVEVTAPKSLLGNLGAAGGAVELIASLWGLEDRVPATRNYRCPDPACPVNVLREPRRAAKPAAVAVNRTPWGQTAAVAIVRAD